MSESEYHDRGAASRTKLGAYVTTIQMWWDTKTNSVGGDFVVTSAEGTRTLNRKEKNDAIGKYISTLSQDEINQLPVKGSV